MNTQLLNLLLLLVFAQFSCFLVLVPVSAKVFLSIDCGSSSLKTLTDENSIVWVGDGPYVQTGETHRVNVAPNVPGWDSRVMSTLRAFPTRKKNCYSVDISKAKDTTMAERVLVRASFYYGNYDKKSNPPTFNLQFNGNNWGLIGTSMGDIQYREVVYSLSKGNIISVCLAQSYLGNIPIISALEIRSLDSDAYSYFGYDYPVHFLIRDAFGANTTIRYPQDSFDRIWDSTGSQGTLTTVRSNSPSIKVDVEDNAPEAVFRTAIIPSSSTNSIIYSGTINSNVPTHFNVYFSEVIKLDATQKRSFNITVNNNLDNSIISPESPVIPPYGSALEVHIFNVSTFNSSFRFELLQTSDSTLPPLLNALEWYTIGDKLVQGTNSNDVKALGLLQRSFIQLQGWSGDPCLPSPYTWDWVDCSLDTDSPRVTALYLNDLGLTGILPDFSAMDALKTIDLGNNNLKQEIPEFLGTFRYLTVLYLADNNFFGTVPSSILNNINLMFDASGNPDLLCTTTSVCNTNTKSRFPPPRTGNTPRFPSAVNRKSSKTLAKPIMILVIMFSGLLL